jgi:DNA-directed RNA polymerase specialized sigma24 family protein
MLFCARLGVLADMSFKRNQAGVRRRGRRDPRSEWVAASDRQVLAAGEGRVAEQAHTQPLVGSPPGRMGLSRARGAHAAKARGHDFNDPDLYARMRAESRRIYHRAFGITTDADWDAAFNFAYGQAWNSERRKGPIDELASWLTTAAHNAVVSEFRKTARVDLLADEETFAGQTVTDLAETVEDRQLLRDAISCLKTSLPERVRLVWTMRFAGDYEPSEIQRRLKLTKKGYEKDLEHATRVIVNRLESARASGICSTPDMASMVRAYAIWGERDGSERAQLAREHLAQCSACRGTIRTLRAAQRAAAFFPPPLLPFAVSHQPTLAVIPRTLELFAGRIQDGLTRIVKGAQNGLTRAKQFVVSLITRGPSGGGTGPERAATVIGTSSTSGALATKAVIGCLAAGMLAGGGACLKAAGVGVPSLGGLIKAVTSSQPHRSHPRTPRHRVLAVTAERLPASTLAAATQAAATPAPATRTTTAPHSSPSQHRSTSTSQASKEFGIENRGTHPVQESSASASAEQEASSNSGVAHAASRNEGTSVPASPSASNNTAAPHSARSSPSPAEKEFGGP